MKWLVFFLLIATPALASDVVCFDDTATPKRVTDYIRSVNTPDFSSRQDCLINPDLTAVAGVPRKYWRVQGTDVTEMTAAQKTAFDDALAAALASELRQSSLGRFQGNQPDSLFLRALTKTLLDEINLLRSDVDSMSKQTNQIDDITRPERTMAQVRNSINNKINNKLVDE